MTIEWTTSRLKELSINLDGRRRPVKESDRRPGPYPYYGASGVVDHVDDYLFDGEYLLVAEDGENLRTRQTPIAFLARGKFWVNNHAHIITGNERADTRFLMYALRHVDIDAYLTGAVMPKLTQGNLNRIEVSHPKLHEQRAIAGVLGALDDKIEQNRRTAWALERLARAIFRTWFVDFEPVEAKAAGAPAFPGMPQPVFDALPTRFVDSDIGPVPEGWEVTLLGDQVRIVRGRSYKSTELQESRTALVTLKSIERGGGYRADGLKPYVGMYKPDQVLNPGDLVVAFTDLTQDAAVVGKPAIVRKDARYDVLVASLDLGVVRPCGRLRVTYLYCLCKTEDFQRHVYGHTNGSTVLHLGKAGVPTYPIALPDVSTLGAFHELTEPLFDSIYSCETESAKLAAMRDYLLPRLLSGRVRVEATHG